MPISLVGHYALEYVAVWMPMKNSNLFITLASVIFAVLGFVLSVASLIVSPFIIYFSTLFESERHVSDNESVSRFRVSYASSATTATENSGSLEMHSTGHDSPNTAPEPHRRPPNIKIQSAPPDEHEQPPPSGNDELQRRKSLPNFTKGLLINPQSPPPSPSPPSPPLRQSDTTIGMGSCLLHPKKSRSSNRPISAREPLTTPTSASLSASFASGSRPRTASEMTTTTAITSLSTPEHAGSIGPKTSLQSLHSHFHRAFHPHPHPHPLLPRRPSRKESSSKCALGLGKTSEPPSPTARTRPYEAPYFFPPPGSPEAVGYVQRAREDLKMDPSASGYHGLKDKGKRRTRSQDLPLSPLGHNVFGAGGPTTGDGAGEAGMTVIAPSAPHTVPTTGKKLKKVNRKKFSFSASDGTKSGFVKDDAEVEGQRGVGNKPKSKLRRLGRAH